MRKLKIFCPDFMSPELVLRNYFRKIDVSVDIIDSVCSYGGEPIVGRQGLYNCDQYMFEHLIFNDLSDMAVSEEVYSRFVLVHAYPALTRLSFGPEACRDLLSKIYQAAQSDPDRYFIIPLGRTFQTFVDYWVPTPRNVIFLNFEKIHPTMRTIAVPYLTNYPLGFDFFVPSFLERSSRSVFCGNYRAGIRGGIIHDIRTRASSTHAVVNVEAGRSKWIPSKNLTQKCLERRGLA